MAYEYDRFEREDGGSAFLMGLLAGTVLGAGLGMLFAPRTGNELRGQLTETAGRWQRASRDAYSQASDKVTHLVDRGRDAYERARTQGSQDTDTPDTPTTPATEPYGTSAPGPTPGRTM